MAGDQDVSDIKTYRLFLVGESVVFLGGFLGLVGSFLWVFLFLCALEGLNMDFVILLAVHACLALGYLRMGGLMS